jgi:hypothetical protein
MKLLLISFATLLLVTSAYALDHKVTLAPLKHNGWRIHCVGPQLGVFASFAKEYVFSDGGPTRVELYDLVAGTRDTGVFFDSKTCEGGLKTNPPVGIQYGKKDSLEIARRGGHVDLTATLPDGRVITERARCSGETGPLIDLFLGP